MSRLVILFLLFSPLCLADTLRIGLPDSDYPPYHFMAGKEEGIVSDLLNRFAKQYGVSIDYFYVPEKRSQKMLDEGLLDGRIESVEWYVGQNQYYWSDALAMVEDVLVMPSGCHIPMIEQLAGYVLMARYGYTYPQFEHLFQSGDMHRENFYSEFEMLLALMDWEHNQRVAVISRDALTWYFARNNDFKKFTVSDYSVGKAPLQLQFAFDERGKETSKQFNDFLKNLKSSGEFAKIMNNYQ
ncbi:hypothetical protein D0907_01210 [Pseudoalteromonas lipolytica]|uniref:Solute-binding protein family 3/N-terminal domain-containing protein n=1 Tax=Pseudoalteromonas lipolytica TaxID=570156 RepID=A0AAD0S0G8_9GAMM|nr:transporter substrate-binding domain-containing protein [Pseudoalteromonas donghaensis]AXV63986.1 hypothetical protein D0907_01210 [Pseudoalteromonas donghaensis]